MTTKPILIDISAQKTKKRRGYYTASFILALSDTISFSLPDTSHPPMNGFASLNRISLVTLLSLVVKDLLSSTSLLFTFISSFSNHLFSIFFCKYTTYFLDMQIFCKKLYFILDYLLYNSKTSLTTGSL